MNNRLLHRRDFVVSASGMFLALHADGLKALGEGAVRSAGPTMLTGRGPRITQLRLKTSVLREIRDFYSKHFEFPILAETADKVTFDAGATRLQFDQVTDGSRPYYHFAFNIPENKLQSAKVWLQARTPILRHAQTGSDVIHFEQWNAHSLFFYDPAGNLGELIARHTLPNAGKGSFEPRDILYASEIGFVPPDQALVFDQIRNQLKIEPYLESRSFLGDEYGILIVIPQDILWIPEYKKKGMLCPTHVTIAGHGARRLQFDDLSFEIISL